MLYKSSDKKREQVEVEEDDKGRSAFRRDFGRLLHSPAFRRLQGKTQLFPGHESDFFRNRLTHSLEVAQIAKGITQQINATDPRFKNRSDQLDLDLVEFAGLAHDLGHPPFGHNGEKALDDCMRDSGGFEGNAQTLRILSKIEKKVLAMGADAVAEESYGITANGKDIRLGLNLTYRSLAAILKYDSPIPSSRKKGAVLKKGYYETEKALVRRIKANVGSPGSKRKFKTIECQIMDLADDIAYSTYDLEDAMKGGFTHYLELISQVANDARLRNELVKKVRKDVKGATPEEIIKTLINIFPARSNPKEGGAGVPEYTDSKLTAEIGYFRTKLTSELVGRFVREVRVRSERSADLRFAELEVPRATLLGIAVLKHLNYLLMIMSPRLKVVEYRGYDVVKQIFQALVAKGGHLLLPPDYKEMYSRLRKTREKKRLVCDFVAGMTDRYAIQFYNSILGNGSSIYRQM